MKSFITLWNKKDGKYFSFGVRLIVALLVSHYLVVVPQTKSFWQIMQQTNYYWAMLFSTLIAVALLQCVHSTTRYLDSRINWEDNLWKRGSYQLIFGVLLVLLLDYLFIRFYFWYFDNDFEASGYMQVEFQIITIQVLLLNLIYVFRYYYLAYHIKKAQSSEEINVRVSLGDCVFYIKAIEILAIIKNGNVGTIYTTNKKLYNTTESLEQHVKKLPAQDFMQVNRSEIYARWALKGYYRKSDYSYHLQIKFMPYEPLKCKVSRNRLSGFLNWFHQVEK
ncbi:LytTR family DNA-binding domain-containing protein [Pedobacter glucosidilyticus]|uniref:LytTR family DNA-binding domain-containing protein n=1 Tax=Pedobacter glucosidilyticus TaxID=1122941 RepID=UPI00041FAA90|nr:LytTR family DNA-binding domain-containing protein [Pedobacter glucosidilyticus]